MSGRKLLKYHIVLLLPLLLLIHVSIIVFVSASSTPKNLVNLYTHSPNDNLTNSKQFQNEYQYRQGTIKSTSPDRYKSSTTPTLPDSLFDHSLGDLGNAGTSDYSYQDNRSPTNVPDCKGRLILNDSRGYITDGPGYYQTNLQCIWLIDSGRDNATIRIQFHQFNTECNYDYLYIFDGDSIYSPLVAALSGDMKDFSIAFAESRLENMISSHNNNDNQFNRSNSGTNLQALNQSQATYTSNAMIPIASMESRSFELKTNSGKAFIYFHSDTAQSMPGFYMTYTIDSCPLDCSNKGECEYPTLTCKCNSGYFGDGCQFELCPANCTSPQHGFCDKERSCICNKGFYGSDCSLRIEQQTWVALRSIEHSVPARAYHQAIVVDGIMWIIGGKVQVFSNTNMGIKRKKKTITVLSFDIAAKQWTGVHLEGVTGIDHLAELSGHSVAAKGNKIFIYGGMALNNTVLDSLTVLDTKTNSLSSLTVAKKKSSEEEFMAPIAVVGHSANIIDSHMYVFLGYNPLYGYLNYVQKFNLADNSWSFVGKKGSTITGCIGHTTSFDPVSRLVYLYGGHNAHRLNTLYLFDPQTEAWTFLQSGPSPRYYHSSLIIEGQLIIFGGNSYNTSHQSDQCFQQTYLTYDLICSKSISDNTKQNSSSIGSLDCGHRCWQSIDDPESGILKRHGQSVVSYNRELILFGGFNGILLNDLRFMNISRCDLFLQEFDCVKQKLAMNCHWNPVESKCEDRPARDSSSNAVLVSQDRSTNNCSKSDIRALQHVCEGRETCTDCLSTNLGCVWCGFLSHCQYNKCKSSNSKAILDPDLCYKDESIKGSLSGMKFSTHLLKDMPMEDLDNELDCKQHDNCYLCHSRPHCSWQNDVCAYNSPSVISSPPSSLSSTPQEDLNEMYANNPIAPKTTNSSRFMQIVHPFNLAAFTTSLFNSAPYHSCDLPCYLRRSCAECTTTKCIWCSTSEQCVDSSAYFAYHSMGQCMHYVAHHVKCPAASCADIESCDKCLTNPKCGWLNDISNTGKGRCIEGNRTGPSLFSMANDSQTTESNSSLNGSIIFPNWFYTSCPACQCNGHSYCRSNSSFCVQNCQDNTEGFHCDKCVPGYYGDPINGGICRPCRCNGHAHSCDRETGKCYCSTKGIIGHTCNKCDDQHHYIGDLSNPANGTCYYNLTTDYQYTFNMSKPEDHFYSDINFINVPLRKDSDVDFTIACSRLALVNITAGISYKTRKAIHSSLECGSFRLRFQHDRHVLNDANYSFFVHVYKFQTPLILQIAFSQHRTLYLPQFFFTFMSCFMFFFALSGAVWKLKHEYDLYVRRQRQFIEMEQMASRPFSSILLELFKPTEKNSSGQFVRQPAEPTPISFEPCFGSNVGVMSLFVQLPGNMGKPSLAIGSALVTLDDDTNNLCDDSNPGKRSEKEHVSVQNI